MLRADGRAVNWQRLWTFEKPQKYLELGARTLKAYCGRSIGYG